MPDAIFADPRLAEIYDAVDADRSDLDSYVAIVGEFGATSVLDIGCGTGTLACRLAADGIDVVGVDPAGASLDVARRKPGADRVRWLRGDASTLPPLAVALALMTGNVAQVFLDDEQWWATLRAVHRAVRPGGRLVFETRDPARRAWEEWNAQASRRRVDTPAGPVETWVELTDVSLPHVSFIHTFRFVYDGAVLTSASTLRFPGPDEIAVSLAETGWSVDDVRDAPDRPGREFVFVARRADHGE